MLKYFYKKFPYLLHKTKYLIVSRFKSLNMERMWDPGPMCMEIKTGLSEVATHSSARGP